ncbi:MAG: malectin [Paracoccaceae bacterium]
MLDSNTPTLMLADALADLVNDTALQDGDTISGQDFSIVAVPTTTVGSAAFYLDGQLVRIENVAPYALFGDQSGDFAAGSLEDGDYVLEVVFHAGGGASGEIIETATLDFAVVAETSEPEDPTGPDPTDPDPVDPDPIDPDPIDPNPIDPDPVDPSGPDTPDSPFPVGNGPVASGSLVAQADKIVFHFDGNNLDEDDIAAMPIAALLTASSGIADKMTFLYGNNVSEPNEERQLRNLEEAADFARSLGIDARGYQDDLSANTGTAAHIAATTAHLVSIFESGENVLSIEGGPMEAVYRALADTDPAFHSNITLLSHSTWNQERDSIRLPGITEARDRSDIERDFPDVNFLPKISDQNGGFNDSGWNWMDSSSEPLVIAAREAMSGAQDEGNSSKINDASDAGMLYYALTGDERGEPEDAQAYFNASGVYDDPVTDTPDVPEVPDGETPDTPEGETPDTPDTPEASIFELDANHNSPLSEASYDAETGDLFLLFDYARLLGSGQWGNARHIDAVTINGQAFEIEIHSDDGPRDGNGNYIYDENTVENEFTVNIGAGLDPSDGSLEFGLSDNANGSNQLYDFSLLETDGGGDGGDTDNPIPTDGPVFALNAGGDTFTASNGIVYQADDFGNGNAYSTVSAIGGTEEDGLYQSERWAPGGFTYDVAVENGTYDVELNFAEIWGGAASTGERVFDLFIEETLVFNDLDISGTAGFTEALDLVGTVTVTDGALTISTSAEVQNPKISGFSIWDTEGELDETFTIGSITDDFIG